MRELVVMDGTALLFRAYYGMKTPFPGPSGGDVGAVWGALSVLHKHMRRLSTGHVAVVFDAGRRTFRNDLDANYKANRGAPPEDLVPQFDLIKRACEQLGFAVFEQPGFEADDLMATLARLAGQAGAPTRLFSVDKDLCQLVRDDAPPVVVEDPYTGRVCDAAGVHERMGVPPERVVPYLALIGDSSDNIPGVRGVGPKTARILLRRFPTLDALYEQLHHVGGLPVRGASTLGAKLAQGREDAMLARRLVQLADDVDLGFGAGTLAERCHWSGPLPDADAFFAEHLGFRAPLVGLQTLAG